ncbi:hypothetical protein [Thalassobaculum litoreum]|uniref:Uncharacterized protein n=1 Tax=Thalassobaculum litoreum DSM 18839 TaxID=1123362 RepID=A0A8G2BJG2_9PROT|nr:hypothetical protein [Thalassobaculum litoreum]SDF83289.1 hypothetical protein SAMN05660686_02460 [Thalassobaculum litoreum DSM 18839]
MAIKIISEEGRGYSTRIIDTESGQDLTKLVSVALGATISIDQIVTLRASLMAIECEVTADVVEWRTKNPATGEFEPLAAIEFRDGRRVEFNLNGSISVWEKGYAVGGSLSTDEREEDDS